MRVVKIVAWAGALTIGALGIVLLGVSMLAASETTGRATSALRPYAVLMTAELKAVAASNPEPQKKVGAVSKAPCVTTKPGVLVSVTRADTVRKARCLFRHGFLSESALASIVEAKPAP